MREKIVSNVMNKIFICNEHIDSNIDLLCDTCKVTLSFLEYTDNKTVEAQVVSGDEAVTISGNMPKNAVAKIYEINKTKAIDLTKKYIKDITNEEVLYAYDISLVVNSEADNNLSATTNNSANATIDNSSSATTSYNLNATTMKYQPKDFNQSVRVKLSNLKLDTSKTYALLHIMDNDQTEMIPATVLNKNEIEFKATSFSVYIVVQVGNNRVTFEGENFKVYDINNNKVSDGAIVTTGTSFSFIIKPDNGYGITDITCIDSGSGDNASTDSGDNDLAGSGDSASTGSGYLNRKGGIIENVSKDLTIKVTTIAAPTITTQPVSAKVIENEKATFSVVASGTNLTYQWQYRENKNADWVDITSTTLGTGYNTDTFTFTNTLRAVSGYQFRCLVGDENFAGHQRVKSEPAIISIASNNIIRAIIENAPEIIQQPDLRNAKVIANSEKASFEIVVKGKNLSFNWQYRENREDYWKNASAIGGATNSVQSSVSGDSIEKSIFETKIVTYEMAGYELRCVVGNSLYSNNNLMTSNIVTLIPALNEISEDIEYLNLKITKQPVSQKILIGDIATFSILAEDANTYKWQYKLIEDNFWSDCNATISNGYNTETLTVNTNAMQINTEDLTVTNNMSGYEFRCIVSDSKLPEYIKTSGIALLSVAQGSLESNIVNSSITGEVEVIGNNVVNETLEGKVITIDPEDCEIEYQWYYGDTTSIYEATEIEGATAATFTITEDLLDKYIFFGAIASSGDSYQLIYDITTAEDNVYDTVKMPIDIATLNASVEFAKETTYNGKAQTPAVTVMVDDATLKEGIHYEVSYENNVNASEANVSGEEVDAGNVDVSGEEVDAGNVDVSGEEVDAGNVDVSGEEVDVDNLDAADETMKPTIIITGIGIYEGTITKNFTILPKPVEVKWSNTNLVYNGIEQAPTATADTGVENEALSLIVKGAKIEDGGPYVAEVDLDLSTVVGGNSKLTNYDLTNSSIEFYIEKIPLVLNSSHTMNREWFEQNDIVEINLTTAASGDYQIELESSLYPDVQVAKNLIARLNLKNSEHKVVEIPSGAKIVVDGNEVTVGATNSDTDTDGATGSDLDIIVDSNTTTVANGYFIIQPNLDGTVFTTTNNIQIDMTNVKPAESLKIGDYKLEVEYYIAEEQPSQSQEQTTQEQTSQSQEQDLQKLIPQEFISIYSMDLIIDKYEYYSIVASVKAQDGLTGKALVTLTQGVVSSRTITIEYVGDLIEPYVTIELRKQNGISGSGVKQFETIENTVTVERCEQLQLQVAQEIAANFDASLEAGEYELLFKMHDKFGVQKATESLRFRIN